MRIIGVIDLKSGRAVHARGGRRERYAPVARSAAMAVDGDPLTLARLYVDHFGLRDVYLADLDTIEKGRPTKGRPAACAEAPAAREGRPLPEMQDQTLRDIGTLAALWVDAGVSDVADARRVLDAGTQTLVVGLETLASFEALAGICAQSGRSVAFSLDLRDGVPLSDGAASARTPEEIAQQAIDAGVQSIIVLDVARVGGRAGPDLEMFQRIRRVAGDVPVLAGGGVRDADDLKTLAQAGCAGALVATAIHEGRLTPEDIQGVR